MRKRWSSQASPKRRPTQPVVTSSRMRRAIPSARSAKPPPSLIRSGAGEPRPTEAETAARARRILELASQEVRLERRSPRFQDAGSSTADVDLMKQMIDEGKINVRLWVMLRMNNQALAANLAKYRMVDYGNGFLTVREHQEIDRRCARPARGVAARAVLRQARRHRAQHHERRRDSGSRRSWPSSTATRCASTPSAIARIGRP